MTTQSNYETHITNNAINYAIELRETLELNINLIPQNCTLLQNVPGILEFIVININAINSTNVGNITITDPAYFELTGFAYIQFLSNNYSTNFIINNLNELYEAISFFQQMLDNLPNEPFDTIPIELVPTNLQNHWIVRNNFL